MSYRKDNLKKVKQAFSEKRSAALAASRSRLERLHREYPDLAAIDAALAETGMRLVEEITRGPEGIAERVAAVRSENERLQADRAEMLAFYGFPPDYTDVVYECPLCGDTGYRGTELCSCMKKALAKAVLESAGLSALAESQSFGSFDLRFYSGENRRTMERNLDFCRDYAKTFHDGSESLLFIGNTGLGKTHLSTSIAVSVIERGFDVVYHSAPSVFAALEAEKFGRPSALSSAELFDADLLILDDLGAENPGALNVNFLYHIVNTRLVSQRPTLINTNLSPAELQKRYTDRVASRLLGEYRVLRFAGSDVRMQKIGF